MKGVFFLFLLIVGSYSLEYKLHDRWYNSKDRNHSILPAKIINDIDGYKIVNSETKYSCENVGTAFYWMSLGQKTCGDFRDYEFICDKKDTVYNKLLCHFDGSENMRIIMSIDKYNITLDKTEKYIRMDTISIKYSYSPIDIWITLFIAFWLKLFILCFEFCIFCIYCILYTKLNILYHFYILFFWIFLHLVEVGFFYLIAFGTVTLFRNIDGMTLLIGIICCCMTVTINLFLRGLCVYCFRQIILPKNQYTMIINSVPA